MGRLVSISVCVCVTERGIYREGGVDIHRERERKRERQRGKERERERGRNREKERQRERKEETEREREKQSPLPLPQRSPSVHPHRRCVRARPREMVCCRPHAATAGGMPHLMRPFGTIPPAPTAGDASLAELPRRYEMAVRPREMACRRRVKSNNPTTFTSKSQKPRPDFGLDFRIVFQIDQCGFDHRILVNHPLDGSAW